MPRFGGTGSSWWRRALHIRLDHAARRVSLRLGYVALPGDRKVHSMRPPTAAGRRCSRVPRRHLGGRPRALAPRGLRRNSEPLGVVLAAGAIFIVGVH